MLGGRAGFDLEFDSRLLLGETKSKTRICSFYDYYLDFVERKRKDGLNPETIRVYMTTYNAMKEFRKEFKICDISLLLIEKFDDHMREINGNSSGGRNPKHKNLRTVILDIQKHNIPVENPYKWFKMPTSEAKEIHLDKKLKNRKSKHIIDIYDGWKFECVYDEEYSDILFAIIEEFLDTTSKKEMIVNFVSVFKHTWFSIYFSDIEPKRNATFDDLDEYMRHPQKHPQAIDVTKQYVVNEGAKYNLKDEFESFYNQLACAYVES